MPGSKPQRPAHARCVSTAPIWDGSIFRKPALPPKRSPRGSRMRASLSAPASSSGPAAKPGCASISPRRARSSRKHSGDWIMPLRICERASELPRRTCYCGVHMGAASMAARIAIAAAALIGSTGIAFAQQSGAETGQNFPDGLGKDTVVSICSGCHDLNRLTAGYTPEGWLAVTAMMRNFGAPVPADQWETVRAYLIRSFPEKPRPEAVLLPGPVQTSIMQWPLPTFGSRPHDPMVAHDGAIWWTGQLANRLGRLDPQTGQMKEYPVNPQTGPHGLVEDKDGNIWFTGNFRGLIGKLDPRSGQVKEYPLPDPRARDPHTIVIDHDGIVWFSVQVGNFVGRLDPATGDIKLVQPPTANARPYGMAVNSKNQIFFVEFGAP